jgi:hypothetical protein
MRIRRPSPSDLARRKGYSREELTQLVLTTLVLGRPPIGWNDRGSPTPSGCAYIERLDELAFSESSSAADAIFVDEYDLPARSSAEKTASPDHAVLWPSRVLVIELKTERASHRIGQCEHYLALARHHNPGKRVDLVYLTGPMNAWAASPPALADGSRAVHLQWAQVLDIVSEVWGGAASENERALADLVQSLVADLTVPWRSALPALQESLGIAPPPELPTAPPPKMPITQQAEASNAMDVAAAVAADTKQRAVEADAASPEHLDELRLTIANEIASAGIGDGHVRPWIWRAASSGGKPLTQLGRETGYEIRLSWYR